MFSGCVRVCGVALLAAFVVACGGADDDDEPVAEEAPSPRLSVMVVPRMAAVRPGVSPSVTLRFSNDGTAPAYLIRRVDGSEHGRHMPYYRWSAVGPDGKRLKLVGRCGNTGPNGLWSDTRWPEDYLIELKPGMSYEKTFSLPLRVEKAGVHRVRFEYVYRADPRGLLPPAGAWQGRLVAAEAPVFLTPER
jgi:hypothetical protein